MISRLRDGLSWIVTVRPGVTLGLLAALTIVLAAGITRLAPQADTTEFLPADGDVAASGAKGAGLLRTGRFVNCGSPSAVLREISQNFTGI